MSQFKKFSNLHNEDLVVIPSPSAASSGDVLTLNAEGDLDWTSISTVSAITAIDTRLSNLEDDLTDMKTESLADPEIMYVYGQDSNGNIANKPLIVATDFIDQSVPAQTPSLTFNRYKETSSEPGADQSFNELTITKTDSNDNQVFIRTILPPKPSFIDVGNSTFLKYWNESDGGHIDWKPVNEVPVSTSAESGKVLKVGSNGTPSWGNPPDGVYILNYSEVSDLNDIDINRVKTQPTFMKVDTDITVTIPTSDTPYTVSVQQGTLMAIDEIGPEGTSGSYTGPKFISFYANNGKNVGGGIMQNADLKLLCMVSLRPFGGVAKAWGANGFLNNDGALLGGTMPAPVTFKCANSRGPGEDTVTTNHALKVEIQSFGRIRTQSLLPAEIETHDFATDETPEEIQFMGWGVTSNRAGYRTINEVPASTSAESGKVLKVDSNGNAGWSTVGSPVTWSRHWEKANGDYNDNTQQLDFDVSASGIKSAVVVIQMSLNTGKYVLFNTAGIDMYNNEFDVRENYIQNNSDFNGIKPSATTIIPYNASGIKSIRIKYHGSQQHKFSTEASGIDMLVMGYK